MVDRIDIRRCVACGVNVAALDHHHTTSFPVRTLCCDCAQKEGYVCRAKDYIDVFMRQAPIDTVLVGELRAELRESGVDPVQLENEVMEWMAAALPAKPLYSFDTRLCWCGCGAIRSASARFRIGHDSKLKSALRKVESGDLELSEIPQYDWLLDNVLPLLPTCKRCGKHFVGKPGLGPHCDQVQREEEELSAHDQQHQG